MHSIIHSVTISAPGAMVKQLAHRRMRDQAAMHAFALACACCRWPGSAARDAAVRAAAAQVIDWAAFLRVVDRQRVAGLAHHALTTADVTLPPREAQALAERANRIARQNLAAAAEAVRLQAKFEAANIPRRWLKGVSLAQSVYGSLSVKHGKDLDLLVPIQHVRDAMRLLQEDGYGLTFPAKSLNGAQFEELLRYGWEMTLVCGRRRTQIDLHWKAAANAFLLVGPDPFASCRNIALVGDRAVDTLGDDMLFLYLCAHGAGHAWMRLKWLADLNALLANKSEADLVQLFVRAEECGTGFCAGQALLLCRELLSLNLPPVLEDRICRGGRMLQLVSSALGAMIGPDAQTEVINQAFGTTRVALSLFRLGRGWRFYVAQCVLLLVCVDDVAGYTLPRGLRFLGPVYYPLIRLPLWLWRHAGHFGGKTAPVERSTAGEPL